MSAARAPHGARWQRSSTVAATITRPQHSLRCHTLMAHEVRTWQDEESYALLVAGQTVRWLLPAFTAFFLFLLPVWILTFYIRELSLLWLAKSPHWHYRNFDNIASLCPSVRTKARQKLRKSMYLLGNLTVQIQASKNRDNSRRSLWWSRHPQLKIKGQGCVMKLADYQNHSILFCLPSDCCAWKRWNGLRGLKRQGEREREAAEPFERCSLLAVATATPPPARERHTNCWGSVHVRPAHPRVNKELIFMQRLGRSDSCGH